MPLGFTFDYYGHTYSQIFAEGSAAVDCRRG